MKTLYVGGTISEAEEVKLGSTYLWQLSTVQRLVTEPSARHFVLSYSRNFYVSGPLTNPPAQVLPKLSPLFHISPIIIT